MLDRDQEPRLRGVAPFEERFYPLLVARLPPQRLWPHALLLVATAGTTTLCGFVLFGSLPAALSYSLAVLVILGGHELAHYLACRVHGVPSTLPYFIPVPFGFGTFGAVIRIRAPFKTRRDLFDVGLAGPLVGFVLALPALFLGFSTASTIPIEPGLWRFHDPLAAQLVASLVAEPLPAGHDYQLNPLLLAGWLGLFVTFLNLLPVGQLDGGHIAYALLGRRHVVLSRVVVGLFVVLSALTWRLHWLVWAVLVLLLGLRHAPPLDPYRKLGARRWVLAGLAALLFGLCAMPVPVSLG